MRFGSGVTARRANLAARYGLVSFLALMSTHQIAWANAAQQQFDIPAQNLSASLQAIATQSHAQLLYSPELVGKINAPALKSSVTVEEALRQLLQGSGLELKVTGDNAFAIIKAGSVSGNSAPVTGCFMAGLLTAAFSTIGHVWLVVPHLPRSVTLPPYHWAIDFAKKAGWESQRILSAQLFALTSFALLSFAGPSSQGAMPRLNAFAAATSLSMLLFAPFLALMRAMAFQLTGRNDAEVRTILTQLSRAGALPVLTCAAGLFLIRAPLGTALYGQNGPWWNGMIGAVALSLPLRFVCNALRAALQARQDFSFVSKRDAALLWLTGIPALTVGLHLDLPAVTFSYYVLPEMIVLPLLAQRVGISFKRVTP